MDMQTVHSISGTLGLLIFVSLFLGVLVYALWPANKTRFHDAAQSILDHDRKDDRL